MTLGVGELSDHESSGGAFGAHLALPAEALCLLERSLDVGNAHVEQDAPLIARAPTDTTIDPVALAAFVEAYARAIIAEAAAERHGRAA